MPPRYPQLPQNLTTTTLTQALTAYLLPSTQTQPNLLNDLSTCLPTYPPKTTVQFYLTHRLTSLALNCLLYPFERYTSFLEDQDFDLSLLSDVRDIFGLGRYGDKDGKRLRGFYPVCWTRGWVNDKCDGGYLVEVLLAGIRGGGVDCFLREGVGWRVRVLGRVAVHDCESEGDKKEGSKDVDEGEMETDCQVEDQSGEAVKEGDKGGEEGEGGRKKEKKKVHWVSIEMNIGDFEHLMSQALLNLLNNVAQDAVGSELDRDVRGLIDSAMEWFVGFD
ncbi:unnamed protein product [Aspergillus oryzae var. brunneus]|uniref:Unnamed protein product n=1 Tax=Aspergillus oryzae var. brunneus TaxID=332754 RepID=A0ABQ6KZ65_ASPOZ|nr:hypothetical protein NYO67_1027 [Aspergillus flavus]GMG47473.1 unnamed protein product [Aspergillus oryzae var. brunneus]